MDIKKKEKSSLLYDLMQQKILILDGAMGTMIQSYKLEEEDYRGSRFKNIKQDIKGNNDILVLTKPDIIQEIHEIYLNSGADIIETNTFSSTTISQADYSLEDIVYELNFEAAKIAKQATENFSSQKPCFVAGSIGPTNRTASISPDVNDPGFRNITFDQLKTAYKQAASGLIDGGSDLLLVETIFDTLNAKAALFAIDELFDEKQISLPVMISGTITDRSGRTLSGQTVEAFWNSVRHVNPFSVGLNCALGPQEMKPFISELSHISDSYICVYPNAGLPNEFGEYDLTPDDMSDYILEWGKSGLLNIVGGCCGTTPDHIKAISEKLSNIAPRNILPQHPQMKLSGLEPLTITA